MRLRIHFFSLIFLLIISISESYSQNQTQVSATGHVVAEVISMFSAVETSQLNFGRFSPGPYGGEIILTPHGTVSVIGSVARGGGFHNPASFYLTGDDMTTFSVNLPKNNAVLTSTSDAKTMVVKNWVSIPAPGPGAGTLQQGMQTVYVGATLEVGTINDNPAGIYTGSYTITFDFN